MEWKGLNMRVSALVTQSQWLLYKNTNVIPLVILDENHIWSCALDLYSCFSYFNLVLNTS